MVSGCQTDLFMSSNKVECYCINDNCKPNEIPQSKWLVKDNKYHIQHIFYHPQQGIQGCEIVEHDISDCFPYVSYRLDRFAFTEENLLKLLQMIKDCSSLNDIEVQHLIKDLELIQN